MEDYSDSDTSLESDYRSSQGSSPRSDYDIDEPSENLEPKLSETFEKYNSTP
jgi:hypothetical protein